MEDVPPAGGGGASSSRAAGMSGAELLSLYDRAIKFTAENKLTKNNVWDMDIIYHMPSIIRRERALP